MQSEEFDKKVVEAAERHHPAYDEKAWNNMEKLLDKHLPQKKDSRRRILWLLLLLLAGAGTFIVLNNRSSKHSTASNNADSTPVAVAQKDNPPANNELPANGSGKTVSQPVNNSNEEETGNRTGSLPAGINKQPVNKNNAGSNIVQQINTAGDHTVSSLQIAGGSGRKTARKTAAKPGNEKTVMLPVTPGFTEKDPVTVKTDISESKTTIAQVNEQSPVKPADATLPAAANNPANADKKIVTAAVPEDKKSEPAVSAAAAKKEKKPSKKNAFVISLSAGPDLSYVGGNKLGTVKLIGGASLSYIIKDRISIHTGFYTGRKVYTSSPGSYNPPASWWNYYPNLQKVEADCKVYEIPLSVAYHFSTGKKQGWYAGAGISSLLMKKEIYNYYYKPLLSGPVYSRKWTVRNENNHYFSVLTLSAGYQRKISNAFTIGVEPYMKLPLAGVGFGKVKLNSTGVMFSVGISPFNHHAAAKPAALK